MKAAGRGSPPWSIRSRERAWPVSARARRTPATFRVRSATFVPRIADRDIDSHKSESNVLGTSIPEGSPVFLRVLKGENSVSGGNSVSREFGVGGNSVSFPLFPSLPPAGIARTDRASRPASRVGVAAVARPGPAGVPEDPDRREGG